MIDRKKIMKALELCYTIPPQTKKCRECPYDNILRCSDQMHKDALELLKEQEKQYPVCGICGKEIDRINTSIFNYDGSDSDISLPVTYDKRSGCVMFSTTQNWTGYDLMDEERKEGIRCPYCGAFPFDVNVEIEFNEPVEVMMWKSN